MSLVSDWRRLNQISWRDRALLAEAAATVALASIAIRVLPFRKVVAAAGLRTRLPAAGPDRCSAEIERCRWAVNACARRLPWKIVCFQKGLALHKLLERRRVPTNLHYGVAQDAERGLSAHVWVTYRGSAIIGGEEAPRFTCLATFPAGR